jgi:hypothetical protein
VTDSGLGGVVRSLRLRDVDDGTAHGSDHDNAARCLALHQMLSNTDSEEPGAVHVDTPELLHAVVRVVDGGPVLSEPSRSHLAQSQSGSLKIISGFTIWSRTRVSILPCCAMISLSAAVTDSGFDTSA